MLNFGGDAAVNADGLFAGVLQFAGYLGFGAKGQAAGDAGHGGRVGPVVRGADVFSVANVDLSVTADAAFNPQAANCGNQILGDGGRDQALRSGQDKRPTDLTAGVRFTPGAGAEYIFSDLRFGAQGYHRTGCVHAASYDAVDGD